MTFRCQTVQTNILEAVKYILRSHLCKCHADILELAKLHSYTTARPCKVCSFSKTVQNTLNTHGLIQLYHTPIKVYCHALSIAEIGFEVIHQPLKKVVTMSTDSNAHISAVHNVLFRNYAGRVSDFCKWPICSYRRLSSCTRRSMKNSYLQRIMTQS